MRAIIWSLFSTASWVRGVLSLVGVALRPTSMNASGSEHLESMSLTTLNSFSEYSHKFKSASPNTPLPLSPAIVSFDYIDLFILVCDLPSLALMGFRLHRRP